MSVTLLQGDCLEIMPMLPAASVDLVLCDLPYGTTACKWDAVIPFAPLFAEYWRFSKASAPVVLTAVQPFSSQLVSGQLSTFRYEWVWVKNLPTGFATANRQPMRAHESVLVFYRAQPTYNKQDTGTKIADRKLGGSNGVRAAAKSGGAYGNLATKREEIVLKSSVSPRTTLEISCVPRATGTLHPTQKPVALMEYLIKTYTNPGDTVLDNCMGSGTTGVACVNTGRSFIGIEIEERYCEIAAKRLAQEVMAFA